MMQASPVISLSPSFTTYSSSRIAEIAARVVEEFRAEGHPDLDDEFNSFCAANVVDAGLNKDEFHNELLKASEEEEEITGEEGGGEGESGSNDYEEEEEEEDDEEEFEFAFLARDFVSSPTPADEIFYNGQIRPIYPVFNRDLLLPGVDFGKGKGKGNGNFSYENSTRETPRAAEVIRLPLRKLFMEDREPPSSCSSSDADDLERVPAGTYCVWTPKKTADEASAIAAANGHCKKSNSTGSSKRWRFRDLLHRSNSDGKDRFVFLTPSNSHNSRGKKKEEKVDQIEKAAEAPKIHGEVTAQPKNGADRRRTSFLPYRRDLVGFFANANGLSRNLHPF